MRYPILLLLVACLSAATIPPKPKPARAPVLLVQGLAACPPVTGDCRVILAWTRPVNYVATTDTAKVTWAQSTPTAAAFPVHVTRGAADTLLVPRPAGGKSKSGPVTLCYARAGWTGQACNAALTWTVTAPVVAPDTATGLQLSLLLVTPSSLAIVPGSSHLLCPMGKDLAGVKVRVVPWAEACESAFLAWQAQS